jgi:hypothetical protein
MEQTAVEWLVEQLIQKVIELDEYPYEEESTKIIEQAKIMEKEQMEKMYLRGITNYDPTFKLKED